MMRSGMENRTPLRPQRRAQISPFAALFDSNSTQKRPLASRWQPLAGHLTRELMIPTHSKNIFDGTKLRIDENRPKTTTGGINSPFYMKLTFHISPETEQLGPATR